MMQVFSYIQVFIQAFRINVDDRKAAEPSALLF